MTSFTIDIPDPATLKASRATYRDLPAGIELHRIHSSNFGATEFNGTEYGNARFSPIRRPDDTIIPTIYAAQTFECAISEIILRSPDVCSIDPATGASVSIVVRPYKWRASVHSTLQSTRNLRLVDLTVQGQRRLGVDRNALLAGPTATYSTTRAWAEAIHRDCPGAHGLHYTSHQFGPTFAIMLFGDRVPDAIVAIAPSRSVADPACDRQIRVLAQSFGYEYEDL
ncbi:RES family NAD+ phosphorylase [Loktanella sp. DJP18]|uniref:RES family NAD+ phosphorylase n=1 Tax=Loktanella sp. DJP18 TaxID=3409788 RepID=UPI003BB4F3F5